MLASKKIIDIISNINLKQQQNYFLQNDDYDTAE